MGKTVKSLFTLTMLVALLTLPSYKVMAIEPQAAPTDFGEPIRVTSYEDENGNVITERTYFVPDENFKMRGKSGSGWYRNEKTFSWASGTESTYYAQGYFEWGDGTVSVSYSSGNITNVPSGASISNRNVESGTGKYAYIFNEFAYVTFSCTATSVIGNASNLTVTIRISESGNAI